MAISTTRQLPTRRRWKVGSLILAFFALTAVVLNSGSSTPARAFDVADTKKMGEAIERAGGLRIMAGSAAVGAVGGAVALSNFPLIGPFGVPIGAAAGVWCAQLPDDSQFSKAGDICRALGHAATCFLAEFKGEYEKQQKQSTK
eukprot:TRINITY_DN79743_c0_g1_i1.p1 TRINITY_DN79743_c0_g1~~TRINITY_DN79743_c0_g1_i1.p1  ORF type:complete len:144 (+),score=20.80 TRINITY_DN79743_c0_g1_i1:56-487(+)